MEKLLEIPYDYADACELQERWATKTDIPSLENDGSNPSMLSEYEELLAIAKEQAYILESFVNELYPQTCDPDYQPNFSLSQEARYVQNSKRFIEILECMERTCKMEHTFYGMMLYV